MPSTRDDLTDLPHLDLADVIGGTDNPAADRQEQPPPDQRPCTTGLPRPGVPQCPVIGPDGRKMFPR